MTQKEYKKLLSEHDWYYNQSDDPRWYEKGLTNEKKLKDLWKENPKFEQLYKKAQPIL